MRGRLGALAGAGLLALGVFPASTAHAHAVGVSRGEYRVSGSTVEAELSLARGEAAAAMPGLDGDGDGSVSPAEVSAASRLLAETIVNGLEVRRPSGGCPGTLTGAALAEPDGLAVRATYRCRDEAGPVDLRLPLLGSLSLGHRHLASVTPVHGAPVHAVLYESRPDLRVRTGGAEERATGVAWPLFRLGIQHILTGYDHLLFLLGLVLVGTRLRPLLVTVTAFTAAHSITLGVAALGLWTPSPRFVEPAIALSIAYVGVENWFAPDAARRWLITFPFGLVHGFGFAGALREIALPPSQVPVALCSFNVGVEVGQLVVLGVVLPAILWLGGRRWFADRGVRAVSAAIAVAGLAWFVGRLG